MTSPFPSRRAVHGSEKTSRDSKRQKTLPQEGERQEQVSNEQETIEASEAAEEEQTGGLKGFVQRLADRVAGVSRAEARAWTWGLGIAGIILFTTLLTAGFIASRSAGPEIKTVSAVLDSVEVKGRWGRTPIVVVSSPVEVSSTKLRTQKTGDGPELVEGAPVVLSITAFDGETGEVLNPSGEPNILIASLQEAELGETLTNLLIGKTEGSRLVIGRPLTNGQVEVDVVDVLLTAAKGEPCDDGGPLVVSVGEEGPAVTEKPATAPSDLVVQCLLRGDGPQVGPNDEVIIQYVAINWEDSKVTSSTWVDGVPTKVKVSEVMEGLSHALVDWRAGSRLAVIIPPDMASGEDTVIAVVDILAVIHGEDDE